jgi:hypothetical protein
LDSSQAGDVYVLAETTDGDNVFWKADCALENMSLEVGTQKSVAFEPVSMRTPFRVSMSRFGSRLCAPDLGS